MSIYTMQLRHLIENNCLSALSAYPIFNENYRNVLNEKIKHHYYFDEIGLETPMLFNFQLETKMNEIMPYYNELYKTTLLNFNPLLDNEIEEILLKTIANENQINNQQTDVSKTNGTNNDENLNVFSDTPNALLSIGNIKNNAYASNATFENNKNINEQTNEVTKNSENIITGNENIAQRRTLTASNQSKSKLLLEFRQTIINIDMMIIDELSPLFMGIY